MGEVRSEEERPTEAEVIPAAPGVYLLRHTVTGDAYVGSARNMRQRISGHLSNMRTRSHHNWSISQICEKHGAHFVASVLELTGDAERYPAEKRWIEEIKPTFNSHNPPKARPFCAPPAPKVYVGCSIPTPLHESLVQIAKDDDRSMAYVMTAAIREYVERHAGKAAKPPKR